MCDIKCTVATIFSCTVQWHYVQRRCPAPITATRLQNLSHSSPGKAPGELQPTLSFLPLPVSLTAWFQKSHPATPLLRPVLTVSLLL